MLRRSNKNVTSERLAKHMEELGLNQTQLSKLSGVPAASISRIVHGRRKAELRTLTKLAPALHVSIGYLSGDEDKGEIDPDIASFFRNEWHELTLDERMWLRNTLQMMRQSLGRTKK